jgi:hypothetical protein
MVCRSPVFLIQSLAFRSLRLDRDLVANILDVAVQEVSYLLNGRAERETISEFGQINRRPRPFALSAHGPPHRCPNRKQAGSVLRYFCGALWSNAAWASCRPHRMRDRAHRPAQSSPAGFLRAPGGSTDEPSHYRTREPVHLLPVPVRLALRNPDCPQLARPPAGVIHADFRRRQLPAIRPTTLHPNRVNR